MTQQTIVRTALWAQAETAVADPPTIAERHGHTMRAYRRAQTPLGGIAKRAFDVVASSMALVLLAPLLVVIALAIRLESPGAVLFRQKRAGFRGRIFRIYKFRTMRVAEDGRAVVQAVRGDARVTRIGRFLRRTSLDELPQLLNVLRGEMSLVGPRPHAVVHEQAFHRLKDAYAMRRMARPGITGLAQVSGARGVTDTPEKVLMRTAFDLEYVRAWSFWRDLVIIARTLSLPFRDGAAV